MLLASDDGDGAVRVVQQGLAGRAEQQPREATTATGTGDHQLRVTAGHSRCSRHAVPPGPRRATTPRRKRTRPLARRPVSRRPPAARHRSGSPGHVPPTPGNGRMRRDVRRWSRAGGCRTPDCQRLTDGRLLRDILVRRDFACPILSLDQGAVGQLAHPRQGRIPRGPSAGRYIDGHPKACTSALPRVPRPRPRPGSTTIRPLPRRPGCYDTPLTRSLAVKHDYEGSRGGATCE